jgi:hypothetical protein
MAAQNQPAEAGLRWSSLRISEVSVGVESEGDWEQRSVAKSNQSVSREMLYAVPTLGLGLQGSIYHPNLFQYDLNSQNGVGWQETTLDMLGGGTRSESQILQRYKANASLFKQKPFGASFFAEKDHTTRDYDFFTRATVDRESYGGRVGYANGLVPLSLSLMHTKEAISGQARPLSQDEYTLAFTAYHERSAGNRTEVAYTLNDYTRQEIGAYTQDGSQHLLSLIDHKTFGKKDRLKLSSSLLHNRLDTATTALGQAGTTTRPTRIFSDHEHLSLRHAGSLRSDYNYSFNLQDSGAARSEGHSASAALRHQLYESLNSTLDAHGQAFSSSGAGTALDTTRYGIGLNENYTKRLGKWGRITLGYGGLLDQEHRDTLGQTLFIVGESHTLNDGVITFLNQPKANLMSIQVWDAAGNVRYRELLDYLILPHGERTEIKRVVGGQIPNGGTIRVDYTAVSQPSDSYTTVAHQFQVRLDFFNGLLGLYGHVNRQDNYGGKSLVLENINDKVAGLDVNWRWLRAGAEYQVFDSNLSPYHSTRLFQNFACQPSPNTTLSLDVGQTWVTFTGVNRDLTTYHAIARARMQITPALSLNTEGGLRFQEGKGYDQQLVTTRANLEFKSGKLAVQAGYEYEDEAFLGELRLRHFFFLRAKRTF